MLMGLDEAYLVAAMGALGGLALGLAARIGRFCTLGAIEDILYGGSDHRMRMWVLAIGTAMLLSFAATQIGWLEPTESAYLATAWNPVAHVVGGLIFGYGMAVAGNCGFGALARLGGGDLRSFVIVLVMGVSAYVVMSGPLAQLRVAVFPPELVQTGQATGYAHLVARATGVSPGVIGMIAGVALIGWTLSSQAFRSDRSMVLWGSIVGISVGAAWVGTQWVARETFDAVPVTSFTFVRPVGETILFAMTASGATISFAVGSVAGVWTGAFIGSLIRGHFRWEACEDPRELRRQILGAALMGGGAIIAVGCTVGQGISALSLLAYGAPLTFAAIFVGAALGLRHLIHGFASA